MKKLAILILLFFIIGCLSNEDRDNDNLPDKFEKKGWEIRVFYPGEKNVTVYHTFSSINKKDTDGDGLTDYEESPIFMPGRATDPRKKDTDGDGLTDYEEVKIFGSNPLHWADDIDGDNIFWKGDYEEINFFKEKGIDNDTILEYLKNPDIDGDGILDGGDIDPLRNLKIEIIIESINVKSEMGDKDGVLEIQINVSVETDWKVFNAMIIPYINESLNFTCILDLNDTGKPLNDTKPFIIVIKDIDEGLEMKPFDKDGFPSFDFVKVFEGNVPAYAKDFNIFKDCKRYHCIGIDGEIWFEIRDMSE